MYENYLIVVWLSRMAIGFDWLALSFTEFYMTQNQKMSDGWEQVNYRSDWYFNRIPTDCHSCFFLTKHCLLKWKCRSINTRKEQAYLALMPSIGNGFCAIFVTRLLAYLLVTFLSYISFLHQPLTFCSI